MRGNQKKENIVPVGIYKIDAIDEVDLSQNFTIHYGLRKKFSL